MSTGLAQGCVLSPLLFSLYINALVVELKLKGVGWNVVVCSLLFADDTSLFGQDVEDLEQSLVALQE